MESIILYGGAFDPIHEGHLRVAEAASRFKCADVYLIPNKTPPWKKEKASLFHRLNMIRLALKEKGDPHIKLCLYEANSEAEINYTIDTVRYFAKRFPNKKIYLLIGADAANEFDLWKEPREIVGLANILVVYRPGSVLNMEVVARYSMEVIEYHDSGDVSSSGVRALQQYDIASSVRDYIEQHRLYYFNQLKQYLTPKRLKHSIGVARTAYDIARGNGFVNPGKYYALGLLHDIAKKMDPAQAKKMMEEHYADYIDLPSWTYHQFLGAYLAEHEFGIKDPLMLDAIAAHCTGKTHMTIMEKILYAADKIEPGRGYDSIGYIKKCKRDALKGFLVVLKANVEYYAYKGYDFDGNRLSKACRLYYLGEDHD